ncbi:hypothetical protein [Micromonospora sp. NPDC050276]|uniref:hypothetical protein n=1 Tax=Micromonospora sp. NPDC050276 TaxID=3364278 RepID=UPI0037A3E0C3
MIVASLLLILVAVVLLVLGLAGGSSFLLVISIAASLLAAVALVVGARQAAANRAMADPGRADRRHPDAPRTASQATPGVAYGPPLVEPEVPVQHVPSNVGAGGTGWRQPPVPPVDQVPPVDASPFDPPRVDDEPPLDEGSPFGTPADEAPARARPVSPASPVPASTDDVVDRVAPADDEPAAQQVTAAEAARVARLSDAVEVVDGRPRYHLGSCPHLIGRQPETLPVAEAVELGFTPCAHCAPATALLADARPI